jgi:hypothetical protein
MNYEKKTEKFLCWLNHETCGQLEKIFWKAGQNYETLHDFIVETYNKFCFHTLLHIYFLDGKS